MKRTRSEESLIPPKKRQISKNYCSVCGKAIYQSSDSDPNKCINCVGYNKLQCKNCKKIKMVNTSSIQFPNRKTFYLCDSCYCNNFYILITYNIYVDGPEEGEIVFNQIVIDRYPLKISTFKNLYSSQKTNTRDLLIYYNNMAEKLIEKNYGGGKTNFRIQIKEAKINSVS